LIIIIGVITLVDVSRYLFSEPILTATIPPNVIQFITFLAVIVAFTLFFTFLSRRFAWTLSIATLLLIAILVILKSPALSLQTSIFFRTLANRPTETASAFDFFAINR